MLCTKLTSCIEERRRIGSEVFFGSTVESHCLIPTPTKGDSAGQKPRIKGVERRSPLRRNSTLRRREGGMPPNSQIPHSNKETPKKKNEENEGEGGGRFSRLVSEQRKGMKNHDSTTARVLLEYEKTLGSYYKEIEDLKAIMDTVEKDKGEVKKERDQAIDDLRNVESAFSDLHRYERMKCLLENLKKNEDDLKRRDEELSKKLENREKKTSELKERMVEELERMSIDYEGRLRDSEGENQKLRALLRKAEMKVDTLEKDLQQKGKENTQLNALCDELINGKVG